jgi:hypothetical protein
VFAFGVWDGAPIGHPPNQVVKAFYLLLWITTQSLCLIGPVLVLSLLSVTLPLPEKVVRYFSVFVAGFILSMPVVLICDNFVFGWTGERLWSSVFTNNITSLSAILPFFGSGSIILLVMVGLICVATPVIAWKCTLWILEYFNGRSTTITTGVPIAVYLASVVVLLVHSLVTPSGFGITIETRSSAYPFYVFGILKTETVGPAITASSSTVKENSNSVGDAYRWRDRRLRLAQAIPLQQNKQLPDVVMVVIESMRPELVAADIMPNLAALSEESTHCKYHFSGGNATNHGVFSLVTGLEPVWFDTPQRSDPGMYRWFKSIGYELGFFAGANDWKDFRMDGFIRPELFDEFHVTARNGISSDRRAVELASAFLSRQSITLDLDPVQKPRLAIVYLYGTHAMYQSYPEDQIDRPAADDRFPFPYPSRMRDLVWNRYRNSARTVDRLIKSLLARDRVIVVVGDHGEAFLEDGTIGHGIRLSRYQNMTAAVLHFPGEPAKVLERPTCHADVLPTLLSFLDVKLSDPNVIDGASLIGATDETLTERTFCVRNYLQPDYGLIGPWSRDPARPFAYRFQASIANGDATALNGIDEKGNEDNAEILENQAAQILKWKQRLYRSAPDTSQ